MQKTQKIFSAHKKTPDLCGALFDLVEDLLVRLVCGVVDLTAAVAGDLSGNGIIEAMVLLIFPFVFLVLFGVFPFL